MGLFEKPFSSKRISADSCCATGDVESEVLPAAVSSVDMESMGELKEAALKDEACRRVPSEDGCLAIFSDEVFWYAPGELSKSIDADDSRLAHLLELRLYSAEHEFHAIRSQLGTSFKARYRRDDGEYEDEKGFAVDDCQYLDVAASDGTTYRSTTGGEYQLPIEDATRVVLRNYYTYDGDGLAVFTDFRIVGLKKDQEGGHNG